MSYQLVVPIFRHGLQAIGGVLVGLGWFDESMVDPFIGLGINLGAFVWWAAEQWWRKETEA